MRWIFALVGLATMIAGGGAVVMGWPLVPLERGWTMVIAGAAIGSGGLVCLALAALMSETRRTRLAIEAGLASLASARPVEVLSAAVMSAPPPSPARLEPVAPYISSTEPLASAEPSQATGSADQAHANATNAAAMEARAAEAEDGPVSEQGAAPRDELQPARSFSVGDTTFIVFTDGTIEARTPKGTKRFGSMEEVRGYLEAANA